MRKRRKFTWFPVLGSEGPTETTDDFNQLFAEITVAPNGASSVAINPMVPDVALEGDIIGAATGGQLVQVLGQEYYIERIVGKCFVSVNAPADDPPTAIFPKVYLVGVGIFVARADDTDAAGGQNQPIGAASLTERQENFSPLAVDTIREPWMWRRVWLLSTGRPEANAALETQGFGPTLTSLAGTGLAIVPGAPKTNIGYGSVMDGPHVDVKSVRRVGNDERLWVVIAARTIDNEFTSGTTPNTTGAEAVQLVFDYRVLGRLTRARNRSAF